MEITSKDLNTLVRYYDKDTGWHVGVLVKLTAELKSPVKKKKRTKKIPASDCERMPEETT